ncbi:cytochrome C biogenesis protein CcdC [Priestia megaterium]|uniref:Cytochrome C biogenesis protein CcdC n=2 Tax=Priestia megaterium TaxID=1404 RepID=A0A3D8X149_PRIMG|nr:cytochrome C biogenesis protein CcdC [Priestia megaterium]
MTMEMLLIYIFVIALIGLIIWRKMKKRNKPIKKNGIGILAPIFFIVIAFSLSLSQLMHIPGKPFHLPPYWEMLIAGLLGVIFGLIMLSQTAYEVREDGFIYSKPNKNFKYVIIAIIFIRMALSQYFKGLDSIDFTVLTMTLAFVYVAIWRIGSYLKFRKLNSDSYSVNAG